MLKVCSLVRSYGDFKAVDDVSFTIPSGQIVGLLGHNGAGKTTIMKMLSGYLEPDQGQILVDEQDIVNDLQTFQTGLGYLPESLPVYPDMVVADYLDYSADLKGIAEGDKSTEIKRVVHQTQIAEKFLSPISALSRGYKQRVGVAQAILGSPKLLILDEPTNGLDPTQTEQMRALIRSISSKATVLLSTHIMQEVEALCDRVLILKSGALAVDANLEELRESHRIHLSTSVEPEKLENLLADQEHIESWQESGSENGAHTYQINLVSEQARHDTAAAIVSAISGAKGQVFEIRPIKRDLETLVREVASEEVSHAA